MTPGERRLWTIGGGKGGVGRSFLTASLGVALARMGRSVAVVDANLGAPSLHQYLGLKPPGFTLLDALARDTDPANALIQTAEPGLKILSCSGDMPGMADIDAGGLEEMMEFISELPADCILLDLGSGCLLRTLDLANRGEAIVVTTPEPVAVQSAYAFIRNILYRKIHEKFGSQESVKSAFQLLHPGTAGSKLKNMNDFCNLLCKSAPEPAESIKALIKEFRPMTLINMAISEQDRRAAEILHSASGRFLNINVGAYGLVLFDIAVRRAAQKMIPLDFDNPECAAAGQIRQIAARMLDRRGNGRVHHAAAEAMPAAAQTMGLNDSLIFMGKDFHVQTEDLGPAGKGITTQVFCDGRVILSTRSDPTTREDRTAVMEIMRNQHLNVIREIESAIARLSPL